MSRGIPGGGILAEIPALSCQLLIVSDEIHISCSQTELNSAAE